MADKFKDVALNLEHFTQSFVVEIEGLTKSHFIEVAQFKDLEVDPDYEQYITLSGMGILKLFTLRNGRELIGYCIFCVSNSLHFKKEVIATQNALYITPKMRGMGHKFLAYCDQRLEEMGVSKIFHHVTPLLDFGPILNYIGYEKGNQIYVKNLTTSN